MPMMQAESRNASVGRLMPTTETKLNAANDLGLKASQQALFNGYRAKICDRAGIFKAATREASMDSLGSIDSHKSKPAREPFAKSAETSNKKRLQPIQVGWGAVDLADPCFKQEAMSKPKMREFDQRRLQQFVY